MSCRDTALHIASENGHTKALVALVTAGADVHCKNNIRYDWSGKNHIRYARGRCTLLHGLLVRQGARVCRAGTLHCTLLRRTGTRRR